ncbi:MAG: hypothetical protein IIA44_03280 [Acidobacteria bacterium]|nr:hypothetical protein [Acidobacteriota bacterium]
MRRLVAAATVLAFAFGGFLVIPSGSVSAAVAQWVSYKDKFDERDYDGNNEDGKFSSDWIEVGEANGPVKGHASVTGHSYCQGAYCLQVGGGGLAVGNVGIERSINLDRALEAKVTFLYARDLMGGSTEKEIAFQVSADAGESFTIMLAPPCYADCDTNGALDIFDFLCFQNSFVLGEPYACDCDPDPVCDIFDFLCFQNAFVAGCP